MSSSTILAATLAVVAATTPAIAQQSPETSPSPAPNPVVLKVNGDEVRAAEISMVMLNLRAQLEATGGSATPEELLEVATQRVIEQHLLGQEAQRFGISPDESRVEQLFRAAQQQAGGADALARTLAEAGSSAEELRQMLTNMERARSLIAERIAPTVTVPDEDVEKFYADNADRFAVGVRVHPRHIAFKVPADADEEAERRAHERAEEARERVLAGEPFAEVAREMSDGPSAVRGGDVGLVAPDELEEPFAEAAMALEPGEISPVVRTPFGYHVITVEEIRPAGTRPLSEVRDAIEMRLRQQRTAATVGQLLEALVERSDVELLQTDAVLGSTPGSG